jgi:hypothetical protein
LVYGRRRNKLVRSSTVCFIDADSHGRTNHRAANLALERLTQSRMESCHVRGTIFVKI